MTACRWSPEAADYLVDGEVCKVDEYGDPTRHCSARRTCSEHVGWGEMTCARCLGRCRLDIRVIRDRSPELYPVAIHAGVNSEAANLAGPATDVVAWSGRRVAMKSYLLAWELHGVITGRQYVHARATMEDDDEHHPYTVLTRWQMMLSEDYGHPLPDHMTITGAADYLERNLGRLAHDETQDFPLFRDEIRRCRSHLENVLGDGQTPERGAPCPDCQQQGHVVRMVREYPHWCTDADCERFHYSVMVDPLTGEIVPDTTGDWWICPRDADHSRPHADYEEWVQARLEARGASA